MDLAVGIALSAAAANIAMAAMHVAISRAPGWRIGRLFAAIAFSAGLYNILGLMLYTGGLSGPVYLVAGRLCYLIGTLHVTLWVAYAYADGEGSLRAAPALVRPVLISVAAISVLFAIGGGLVELPVEVIRVAWANVTYHYPATTTLGDVYGLLVTALPAWTFLRLFARFRRGEASLRWQLLLFGVFFLCAVDEALVANRALDFLSLLDLGLVIVVMPLSWQTVRRMIGDARRLQDLSSHLEEAVARRTGERDRAWKALTDNEQHLRDLVANLEAIVWEADPATLELTFVSQGAEKLLGYPLSEWKDARAFWSRHLHPEDRDHTIAAAREALTSKRVVALEYRMLAADGNVRWLRDFIHPVAACNGFPERVRGLILDFTESRHAHDALLQSEERFRSLFDNTTVGLYRTTPDGQILMANPALVRLLGYESFEELSAVNLEDINFGPGYPRSSFREQVESQGVVTGLECAWRKRNGSWLFGRESARAVRGQDGKVLYYDGVVEDFTDRKRLEEALRESEERYRKVVEHQTELISTLTVDGIFTFVNEAWCRFLCKTSEELVGTKWQPRAVPEDVPLVESRLGTLSPTNPVVLIDNRVYSATGQERWIEFVNRGVFDGEGRLIELQSVGRDITEQKIGEQALRESEQRLQQVAECAGVFVWEIDAQGLYTYASRYAEQILGYAADELVGKLHYYDLFPAGLREELKAAALEVFARKAPFENFLNPNVTKGGRFVLLETNAVPLLDQAGNLIGYRGADSDITERKRNEVALRETRATIERQLHEIEAIYASAPVGLAVMDADCRWLRMNERMAEIDGFSVEEHIGRRISEALPELAAIVEPLLRQVLDTEKPILDVEIHGTTPARPRVKRVWSASYYPVRDLGGRTVGVNAVVQEITDRKRSEAALVESEERFRTLADNVPVVIWLTDEAGKVTFFNRQASTFTGRSHEQLKSRNWAELLHPEDVERVRLACRAAIQARSSGSLELRLLRGDGEYRWLFVNATARFTDGRFAGHVGTMVDITDLKREQEQVLASQKLESLGVLAGGIAHDFNNLLGSVLADAELVANEVGAGSPVSDSVERIRQVAVRASEIVRELMVYSGQETPEFRRVDLADLVSGMRRLLSVSISKHARLEIDIPRTLPMIRANSAQIRQVVINLVTNASEAIGDRDGVIRLAAVPASVSEESAAAYETNLAPGEYVRLEIADTGCGMTEEIRSRLFDPFFTTKFPGRGLGLASVQGIIRAHRGAVDVASSPGAGTRFGVWLPIAVDTDAEPRSAEPAPARKDSPPSRRTVLVVEDEESLRVPVVKMLRKSGFDVVEVENGMAAVEAFRSGQGEIGVVLLDLTLPGLGGAEVLAELRRIRPDLKVVLTTAYNQEIAAATLGSQEAWRFIQKPYRLADIMQLLQEALET